MEAQDHSMHAVGERGQSRRSEGFQLLELMVVLVIVGIVLATAMPDVAQRNRWNRLEGAARNLSTRFQTARSLAVSRRLPYRVVMDPAAQSYVIERQDTDSTWVRDPDEDFVVEGVDQMQVEVGGDTDSVTVVMEPRGTVRAEDAPVLVRFLDSRADTAEVRLVRTGRVTVRLAPVQS